MAKKIIKNTYKGQQKKVEPIRDYEDIIAIKKYLKSEILRFWTKNT